jgi:hypothetical protein
VAEFRTGPATTVIPPANVAASYPVNGMYNLYRRETGEGYLQLVDGQPDLLNSGTELKVRFSTKDGVAAEVAAKADFGGRRVSFPIPADGLPKNQFYRMDLVTFPSTFSESDQARPAASVLHTLYFRTSVHERFLDKIALFQTQATASSNGKGSTMTLQAAAFEPFDRIELEGTIQSEPLIRFTEGVSDYADYVGSLYSELNKFGLSIPSPGNFVTCSIEGTPALWADAVSVSSGAPGLSAVKVSLRHNLFTSAVQDFDAFRSQMERTVLAQCPICEKDQGGTDNACFANEPILPTVRCCCSDAYQLLHSAGVDVWNWYIGPTPKPAPNSPQPVKVSYRLPGGGYSTPEVELEFLYGN